MPARTTAAPQSCAAESDSRSQAQATTVATTGSSIAVTPARVAEMWRSAPTTSENGTIVPRTTIQSTSAQTGAWAALSDPWSDTDRATTRPGKLHHGCTTDQK